MEESGSRSAINIEHYKSGIGARVTIDFSETGVLQRLRLTPEIFQRLEQHSGSELAIQQQLRADFPAEIVTAAISVYEARRRAAGKLPRAEQLWLTRIGLEQSTAWEVANHKAKRFPAERTVLDLCCGIGVDSAALLRRGPVTAVDLNPAMTLRCRWNSETWNQQATISEPPDVQASSGETTADLQPVAQDLQTVVQDVHAVSLAGQLVHVDPDRRGQRDSAAKRLEHYTPNLEWMQQAITAAAGGALKLGPASNFMQKFAHCEIELISLFGECREATVWFGELAGEHAFRATHLPSGETLSADPLSAWTVQSPAVNDYLFDPDPALVRSGLIDVLGEMHNLQRMDDEDEYLTGSQIPHTEFVTAYQVVHTLPNNLRKIKRYLRSHPGSRYEVKCRRLSVDANGIQKKLPKGDGPPLVLFFVRHAGKAFAVVTQRVEKSQKQAVSCIDDSLRES